jgi:hypothetical protein
MAILFVKLPHVFSDYVLFLSSCVLVQENIIFGLNARTYYGP